MSTTNRKLTLVFERYFSTRLEEAGAITPGQKKDLIAQLRRELNEDGRIPLPAGPVKADTNNTPAIRAALLFGR